MKIVPISVKLVHATPFPVSVIEDMGRICYQSQPKGNASDFVKMLIQRGHESVLEHVSAGFRIVTDRGVTHELVRHRLAAFSQESTRYCDYAGDRLGGELSFIEPPGLATKPSQKDLSTASTRSVWVSAVVQAEQRYQTLRRENVPPELARSVLPNALKSEIGMTCNAREWRHVLRLRLSPKAHPQMRQVMALVAKELVAWCPVLFEDVMTP